MAHVWALPLAKLPVEAGAVFERLLSDDERERMRAFRLERHAIQYAAAHALLRWSLSMRYPRSPVAWRFAATPLGKPSLAKPLARCDLRFSLSHTEGFAAVALADAMDIGIDAERIRADRAWLDIAHDCFTPSELLQLDDPAAGLASDVERFHALWTLKEALLKAKGLGLNQSLSSFSVDLASLSAVVPEALAPLHAWRFDCRKPTTEHVMSVALDAPPGSPSISVNLIDDVGAWLAHCSAMAASA